MGVIQELSDVLKSKIAAGEVIERPAYILKELIDNAIDAKAQNIRIDLEKSGIGKIIVTDDGEGMDKEDLQFCFKRYTTSKIYSEEDLDSISSMGFRGEALASIVAIAKVTIKSRRHNEVSGHELSIQAGKIDQIRAKGMPTGTQVIIEDVFSLVPARQKFLRSKQAEYRNILEVITRFAISFPEIRFDVYHEGKKILLFSKSSIEERINTIFSEETYRELIPIQFEKEYISVTGFTSKPQLSYKTARNTYVFINKRFNNDSSLVSAVREVYGTLLEPTSFPHLILFLEIPHHFVDVNVHPRKELVHFVNQAAIIQSIQEGVNKALAGANLRYYDKRWTGDDSTYEDWQIREGGTNTYAAKKLKESVISKDSLLSFPANQPYFQLHKLYIAVPSEKGLFLFDQHAVHERILYEKLQTEFQKEIQSKLSFTLTKPISVTVTPQEEILLTEYQDILASFGFLFEIQPENEICFTSVPKLLQDRDLKGVLRGIIDELFQKEERINLEYISSKMLAYLACRGAVKAGDRLTQKQCKELIEQLKETKNPYTCPHGRPTQVEININYLHTLFKRK